MWKSPTLSPRVIYLLMIIELNSIYSEFPHLILLYYYYFPCVRVSRVRQAMSRARILSSRVGRLEGPVQALGIGIALRMELMEIGGGFD